MLKQLQNQQMVNIQKTIVRLMANKRRLKESCPEDFPVFHYKIKNSSDKIRLYVCGRSDTGALGSINLRVSKNSVIRYVQHPKRSPFAEKIDCKDIECGYGFSVFSDGKTIYGTGINTDAQLGYHEVRRNHCLEMLLSPAPVEFPEPFLVKKMSAGRAHVLILSSDGSIFTLGNNSYGQCGRLIIKDEITSGSYLVHKVPQQDFDHEKIIDIKCGQDHSLALTESGRIFVCGWGADGQTAQGDCANVDQFRPIKFAENGDVNTKFVQMGGKCDTIVAVSDQGQLFGWGSNDNGQLIDNYGSEIITKAIRLRDSEDAIATKIIAADSTGSYTVALSACGRVFVWGYGILGLGPDHLKKTIATEIPAAFFGKNAYRKSMSGSGSGSGVSSVACGVHHCAAVTHDGLLYAWGQNKCGVLGLGHTKDQFFPFRVCLGGLVEKVSCGLDHMIAKCRPYI